MKPSTFAFLVSLYCFSFDLSFASNLNSGGTGSVLLRPTGDYVNHVEYEDRSGLIPGRIWQGKVHRICVTPNHTSADEFCKEQGYLKGAHKSAPNLNLFGDTSLCVNPVDGRACSGSGCKGYHRISCLKDHASGTSTSEDYCARYADASVHLGRVIRTFQKCAGRTGGKFAGTDDIHKRWCLEQSVSAVQAEFKAKLEESKKCVD